MLRSIKAFHQIVIFIMVLIYNVNISYADVLYENGPMVTHTGTGAGGLDESILQFTGLGMILRGFSNQSNLENRLADDFTITGEDWNIGTITFYAFQTGATASTITDINLQIWDGPPNNPNSNIVFGDMVTNRMNSTFNSNILRVTEADSGTNTERQIAASIVDVYITLPAGTYWLDWSQGGNGGPGPYAPPITITGLLTTGNALQSGDDGSNWEDALDFGTSTQQGFPFIIETVTDLIYANDFE